MSNRKILNRIKMLERAFKPNEEKEEETFTISLENLTEPERQTVLRAFEIWDRFVASPRESWPVLYENLTEEQKRVWRDASHMRKTARDEPVRRAIH